MGYLTAFNLEGVWLLDVSYIRLHKCFKNLKSLRFRGDLKNLEAKQCLAEFWMYVH